MHFHAIQALGVEMVEEALASVATVVTLHDAWQVAVRTPIHGEVHGSVVRPGGDRCPRVCDLAPDPAAHEKRQEHSRRILNSCSAVLTPSAYWVTS